MSKEEILSIFYIVAAIIAVYFIIKSLMHSFGGNNHLCKECNTWFVTQPALKKHLNKKHNITLDHNNVYIYNK